VKAHNLFENGKGGDVKGGLEAVLERKGFQPEGCICEVLLV